MASPAPDDHELVPLAGGDETVHHPASERGSRDEQGRVGVGAGAGTGAGSLTRLNGLALVVSLQIGSGIFTAPSQVSQFVTSPGLGLLVWLLGGALVWTGAASFIELGLRIPSNGGIQEYLRTC